MQSAMIFGFLYFFGTVVFAQNLQSYGGKPHQLSTGEVFLKSTLNPQSKIVYIGASDEASAEEMWTRAKVLSQLHAIDNRFNCVFLEWAASANPAFNAYLSGRGSYQGTVISWIKNWFESAGIPYPNARPEHLAMKATLDVAKANRMKVFEFDLTPGDQTPGAWQRIRNANKNWPDNDDIPPGNAAIDKARFEGLSTVIAFRNEIFVENMGRFLAQNQCTRSVVFVGNMHLVNRYFQFPILSTSHFLASYGYRGSSYVMQPFNCRNASAAQYEECAQLSKAGTHDLLARGNAPGDSSYLHKNDFMISPFLGIFAYPH